MKLEEIDTSTTAGKAEVMRLAAEGRRVAVRKRLPIPSTWFTSVAEAWNWFEYDYAIISEPVLDRPARVGGRDFPAGSLVQQVIGRAHAEFDRYHHKRDLRDVASDPEGFLVYANGEPMMAAKKREPVGPEEVWVPVDGGNSISGSAYCESGSAADHASAMTSPGIAVRYIRADLAGEGK